MPQPPCDTASNVIQPNYDCAKCPRLRSFIEEKKQALPRYFNGPVPNFGPENARLLIIGLAPGLHGANQTGRPFTGDWAGDLLYDALAKYGFSNDKYDKRADDGLELWDAKITNVVRCVPPQNKPISAEVNTCRDFLTAELNRENGAKVLITLGKISHDSTIRALGLRLAEYPFGHHNVYDLKDNRRIISSYHCSRYNTNTRRLTEEMFFGIFREAKSYLDRS